MLCSPVLHPCEQFIRTVNNSYRTVTVNNSYRTVTVNNSYRTVTVNNSEQHRRERFSTFVRTTDIDCSTPRTIVPSSSTIILVPSSPPR